ncbi:MAG: HAD family hydrolase [Planctomycetota bacterium]
MSRPAADPTLDLSRYELVIFDCDGVLVDTEPTTNRLLAEVITEAGWPVSTDDSIELFKGTDLNHVVTMAEKRVGRPLPDLLSDYRARMFEAFEAGIDAIDGAAELLDRLDDLSADAAGPRRCVASNGPHNKMQASLRSAGLHDRFEDAGVDRIFSAYDIGRWKPEPDLFLHAAEQMNASPKASLVIEDSVSGVHAARAAGMHVVALAGLTSERALGEAGATSVIRTLRSLVRATGGSPL